uniref:glutathione transferase n=1 Tax=Caenorhabditis tropicalis TaxID=1561998 RepID=A0A1I7T6Q1_9PELO
MVSYKLTYFDGRGAGEICRQIFAFAGQKYEDERLSDEQWAEYKAAGKAPYNQLPMLTIDGKPLAQSHAMARYLAREFGINGNSRFEEGQVNSLADQFKDYQAEVRPYLSVKFGEKEGDADELYKTVFLPAFKKHYGLFTKALKASGKGFLVGDSLTWIDLLIAEHSSNLLRADPVHLFEEMPEMKEHSERIHSIPQIKKWIQERPVSDW